METAPPSGGACTRRGVDVEVPELPRRPSEEMPAHVTLPLFKSAHVSDWPSATSVANGATKFAGVGWLFGELPMPILALGADHSFGDQQAAIMRDVGSNVEGGIIKNSGHWIMEEQPAQTTALIVKFVDGK